VTDDLTPEQRSALDALRSTRGRCPAADALVEYEALAEAGRTAHPAHAHIVSCSRCQLALLHMADRSAAVAAGVGEGRKLKLAFVLPIAAVAVLAVALTLVDRSQPGGSAPTNETVRGTELQVTAPAGATELLREFTWQSPIVAERYRVIVRRNGAVVWQTETTMMRTAPPAPGTIERDVQYEWQVEALDREGNVRMTSPSQPFVVY
jgi:hypothetical protein